jgi:hypothetical protein
MPEPTKAVVNTAIAAIIEKIRPILIPFPAGIGGKLLLP